MHLRQIAERRISTDASGTSLRTLSVQEVQQVAGALYNGPTIVDGPIPPHDYFPDPNPFPPGTILPDLPGLF